MKNGEFESLSCAVQRKTCLDCMSEIFDRSVSDVKNMTIMFAEAGSFNGNIINLEVRIVKSMGRIFSFASTLNGNIKNWEVSIFFVCSVRQISTKTYSNLDVSGVTDMKHTYSVVFNFNRNIDG